MSSTMISAEAELQLLLSDSPEQLNQRLQRYEAQLNRGDAVVALYLYWCYGIALLLCEQEEEAQLLWMMALGELEGAAQVEAIDTLGQYLATAAIAKEATGETRSAWILRSHLNELTPEDFNNLLPLIRISHYLQQWEIRDERLGQLTAQLAISESLPPFRSISACLNPIIESNACPENLAELLGGITQALPQTERSSFADQVMPSIIRLAHFIGRMSLAQRTAVALFELVPSNHRILVHVIALSKKLGKYDQALELLQSFRQSCRRVDEQFLATNFLLDVLLNSGGYWEQSRQAYQQQVVLLEQLDEAALAEFNPDILWRTLASASAFLYLEDAPDRSRKYQNLLSAACQANFDQKYRSRKAQYRAQFTEQQRSSLPLKGIVKKRLKIGYLSHCFTQHSVGWICRWLLQHHDLNQFDICCYYLNQGEPNEFAKTWFIPHVSHFHVVGTDFRAIADKINQDGIDILVDLDSVTLDLSCQILALRPAPIQVTWLGFDGSGLPEVDYYIADHHVLAEDADQRYVEKLYRLPQTYIAVDGFEADVPTLKRQDLGIPQDAAVYLTVQNAKKRHPEIVAAQLQILKAVPGSHLLIKGLGSRAISQNFIRDLAEQIGVERDRLHFLPRDRSEAAHRANLTVADVVLDTYPYNGATTTLETLWMEIPLVTLVGQQFPARNSYTMLKNVGIDAGIAWTMEEYVRWGIRLGTEPGLRQSISIQLHQAKHDSPLWDTAEFAREMERAYEQMWERYISNRMLDQN